MKQTSKILSLVMAVMMLLQLFTFVSFAEDTVSDLPTDLVWDSARKGYFQFTIPSHITDRYNYRIDLYKNGEPVEWTQSSVHPTEFEDSRVYSRSFLQEEIMANGSGRYTYTVTVNGETTGFSTEFTYTAPTETLPTPTNVILVEGQVRWTPIVSEYCSGYFVEYYVAYPDGTLDKVYGQEERGVTSDYQDYSRDNDVPHYFNEQVDRFYNADPVRYPKESAFLMVSVQAESSDIFEIKDSEASAPVRMSEDTETEFKFNLPNKSGDKGATLKWTDIQEYVPERMQFGLIYASNRYEVNITTPATVTFTGNGVNRTETLSYIPLLTEYGAAWYDLEFTLPYDLAPGTYQAVVRLAIADEKDANDVKPYVITIPELTVNQVYDADFAINGGETFTTDKNVTLTFNVSGYTKYKVGDGEYTNLPANGIATAYTLTPESGEKTVAITFANADETKTVTVEKTIQLSNRHTITYYVDGAVFDTVTLDCGSQIQQLAANPTVEGKTFAGWDGTIPATMPDADLTFHAIFVADSTEDLAAALLTEEEIANGYDVATTTSVAVANTAITDELTNQYSEYTVAMTLDITIHKVKEGETPVEISEPGSLVSFVIEIPDSLRNKGDYIIIRDHDGVVETITATPNANGEYLVVSGNTITLYANKFSLYALATREPVIVSGGSSVASYSVNFNTNGGTKVSTAFVKKGNVAAKPADPTKEGYTFGGWYVDEELTNAYDFATKVTKSITLYAKWNEKAPAVKIVLTIDSKDALVNGEVKTNDVAPVIVNDRTMLPIRFLAEALGATVSWVEETRTVTVVLGDITISLVVGESFAMVNGEKVELDCASFIEKDRTYLPIRFVMENLGADVSWDEVNRQVIIVK